MSDDEIIRIYKQVSDELCRGTEWCWHGVSKPLQRFTELVIAADRAKREPFVLPMQHMDPRKWVTTCFYCGEVHGNGLPCPKLTATAQQMPPVCLHHWSDPVQTASKVAFCFKCGALKPEGEP